ncbi:MAG TPA: hypothetical protein VMQ17_28270 [Candidatus Sulfotelmatobacter sp.]|nr:hypothetical protein [Candidatus Sulfotelmatobacter sp.]
MPIVPAGNDAVVMLNAGGGFTVKVIALLEDIFTALEESVTWNVTDPLPPPVGVPEITPVLALKLSPGGNDPAVMLHLYGLVPPDSASVALYALPAVAAGIEVVVTAGGGLTLICKVATFVGSVTEVAVTVAANALLTEAGAL